MTTDTIEKLAQWAWRHSTPMILGKRGYKLDLDAIRTEYLETARSYFRRFRGKHEITWALERGAEHVECDGVEKFKRMYHDPAGILNAIQNMGHASCDEQFVLMWLACLKDVDVGHIARKMETVQKSLPEALDERTLADLALGDSRGDRRLH